MAIPQYRIGLIDKKTEVAFIKQWHYSRKVVPNSAVRFGCYDGMQLVGTCAFGKIINCVPIFKQTPNGEGLELNRLAMTDSAPKNSESWFLMHCIRMLKRAYPWLRFIHTWADGLRCEGGTIYKACGFYYLRKLVIGGLYELPDGSVLHQIAFDKVYLKRYYEKLKGIHWSLEKVQAIFGQQVKLLRGGVPVPLRLPARSHARHPVGYRAQAVRGKRTCADSTRVVHHVFQRGHGGANPTSALQNN